LCIPPLRDSHACRQACALTGFDYGLRPSLRMTQGCNVPPPAFASRPRHSERSEAESKSERADCERRSNDGQRRLESRAERNDILRDSHACRQACALTGFDYGLRPSLRMTQGSCASLTEFASQTLQLVRLRLCLFEKRGCLKWKFETAPKTYYFF